MSVGLRIKELRISKGYNQTQLANLSKLKPPAISQYEAGIRLPSNRALNSLSKALGISVDYILNGEIKTVDEDKEILALYNSLDKRDKEHLYSYLKFLAMKNY